MYPEVEQYIKTRDEAAPAYTAANAEARAKRSRGEISYDDLSVAMDANYATYRVSVNEAWNALKGSSDPLVRYIAENCKDYQDEAQHVLKALPATLDELDSLAAGYDWCRIWNQFRDQAVGAGLFREVKTPSAARQALASWAENSYGMGRSYVRELNKLVDAIVAEESATADAPATEAPASV